MPKSTVTTPDLVVLSYLTERAMHGYELNQTLEEHDAKDWAGISRPQVYYSLKKLKKMNYIKKSRQNDGTLGPDRQVFEITESGKTKLKDSVAKFSWATQRPAPPFLTWLALSDHLSKPKARKVIEERKRFLLSEVQREKETLKQFPNDNSWPIKKARLMIGLMIEHFESELRWLGLVEVELQ